MKYRLVDSCSYHRRVEKIPNKPGSMIQDNNYNLSTMVDKPHFTHISTS